jgi:hypothetical protein
LDKPSAEIDAAANDPSRGVAAADTVRRDGGLVLLRGIAGGMVGGVLGFFVFQWLARRGLYGMMIPGAAIGLGAGLAARGKSVALGVICIVAAIALAVFAEWFLFPFVKDKSFS